MAVARRRDALRLTDPDHLAWMAERLTAHPWQCFEQELRLTNEDATADALLQVARDS